MKKTRKKGRGPLIIGLAVSLGLHGGLLLLPFQPPPQGAAVPPSLSLFSYPLSEETSPPAPAAPPPPSLSGPVPKPAAPVPAEEPQDEAPSSSLPPPAAESRDDAGAPAAGVPRAPAA
ncbi:MAG: hypothetical protein LBQ61_08555, partial [Spirochaetales bacterium]|nr:hypothetical protein [Spirochaetales bacterium]